MSAPAEVLGSVHSVAVIGLSTDPQKEAHQIPKRLQAAGFRVLPVHPSADLLLGERVHRSLAELANARGAPDLVLVFRPAEEAPGIARAAVAAGARVVWLQVGIRSEEARRIVEGAGLAYVEDECAGTVQARERVRPSRS